MLFIRSNRVFMPLLFIGLHVLLTAACALGAEAPPQPRVPRNLFTNPDFEIDADRDGLPDGWFRSEPQYWCGPLKDSARWKELHGLWVKKGAVPDQIPFRTPGTLEGGTYRWEAPGHRGGHAISIDETTELKWGEWDTVVEEIKPNTNYVIMGWRKQSVPGRRKASAAPWLKIAAFGRMIPVRGTIGREAWIPFAVSVNSGKFEGKCAVGFIVEPSATKVWLDQVVMFEGAAADIPRFRVGLKGAAIEYPFHQAAYASPDIQCPFFFDVVWSFHGANGDAGLEVVIDLPDGLDLTWSGRGTAVKLESRDPERTSIEGRPYVRRAFAVLSAKDTKEFDSAGKRAIRLWLKTSPELKAGTFEAFYHARWRGGRQPDQPLKVRIIRIEKVRRPRGLVAAMAGASAELVNSRANILVKDLARAGMNCIVLDDALKPDAAGLAEKAGISPAIWFELDGAVPKDGLARDAGGRPVPGRLCPSYRPKDPIKTLFAGPAKLVKEGTTTFFTDLRNGRRNVCFCARCLKEFEAFVKKHNPDLKHMSPVKFEAEPAKHKELRAAWREFRSARLTDLYWTFRKSLDEFRKGAAKPVKNASDPLRLFAVMPTPAAGLEAIKAGAIIDYGRMAGVFDAEIIEPRMQLAEAGGTPGWVGDETARLIKLLPPGGRAGVAIEAGSCDGRDRMAPVTRHSDVRDQVLEAVVAGARTVVLQPFYAVDGMDIKQFSEALGLLAPFEEIIADGEPRALLRAPEGSAAVWCLAAKDRMLLLVTDYSAAPAATVKLTIERPKDAKFPDLILVDVEAARFVTDVKPDTKQITVPLGRRSRLFYLGPRRGLPITLAKEK